MLQCVVDVIYWLVNPTTLPYDNSHVLISQFSCGLLCPNNRLGRHVCRLCTDTEGACVIPWSLPARL